MLQRVFVGVVIASFAIIAIGWWIACDWAFGTCGALDRSTGSSGCVARHHVSNFEPLSFVTMAPVDAQHVRLLGMASSRNGLIPSQLVINLQTGAESGRSELPLGSKGDFKVIPSQHGQEVAVICVTDETCAAAEPKGVVLSVASGRVLETLKDADAFSWHFAGERPQTVLEGAWLSDTVSAEPDMTDGGIILRDENRVQIDRFSSAPRDGDSAGSRAIAVRVSQSGQYLALIESAATGGSRISIYDVSSRTLLKTITTGRHSTLEASAIWMPDDQHLVLLDDGKPSQSGRPSLTTELFVFKVR